MKKSITNMSPGVRVLNVIAGEHTDPATDKKTPIMRQDALLPGETMDMDVVSLDEPVFKGMVDSGELIVGEPGSKPPATPAEKVAVDAAAAEIAVANARKAGFDEGYAKGQQDTLAASGKK